MREVTLQIHTTAHEKARVRERKEQMLQGTARHANAGSRADKQHRSCSCHGREFDSSSAADGAASSPSSSLTAGRPKSASAVIPEAQMPVQHAAGAWSATDGMGLGHSRLWGQSLESAQGISKAQNLQSVSALSHGDLLACTGATSYRVHTYANEDEHWAEENARILAGEADSAEGAHGRVGASSTGRPQDWLPELHIPRMESAETPATPTTVPSTTPSTNGTPVRFGMDTLERKQFGAVAGGVGSPPPLPVSPLSSPVIRFGTGLQSNGGLVFAFPQTPASAASRGQLPPSLVLSGSVSKRGTSPLARIEQLRSTSSTDYSDDYSEVRNGHLFCCECWR